MLRRKTQRNNSVLFPLTEAMAGERCCIRWMLGPTEIIDVIRTYGLAEEEEIRVSSNADGNVIIRYRGKILALCQEAAMHVKVVLS